MGFFSTTPQSKKERKLYEQEKAAATKLYDTEKQKARNAVIKERARFDALPRTERAKQRLSTGFNKLKTGAAKFQAWDAKMEAKAQAQGSNGGIILQSMRQDRANPSTPLVKQSLQGAQGEGLIQQSLRGDIKKQRR